MCGITGWINFKDNLSDKDNIIKKMTDTLKKRGPDDFGYVISKHVLLGHRRLVVVDPSGGTQPMTRSFNNKKYTIVYNGELYNTEELREELTLSGFKFESYSDTEVLLNSYIHWGQECVKHINGIFAFGIWDEGEQRIFLARDPLGVKPLFYSITHNSLIFGSEIKALLAHPYIEPIVDETGLTELFSLGPARPLGSGIFKNIKEIPPANFLVYDINGYHLKEYWFPELKDFNENFDTIVEHTRSLLIDAIKRQLVADVPVCTFLSGGLDSSVISAIASSEFKNKGLVLNTYSIDYEENDVFFKADVFQPTSDKYWALKMSEFIGSNHHNIVLNNYNVAEALLDAVKANDLPGMADVDSSLFLFSREIKKNATVALSGECADEIFGGYPWYTREEDIYCNTFPWSKSIAAREELLSDNLKGLKLRDYIDASYKATINKVPHSDNETQYERKMRELYFLNIKWFMLTLLNRKDRMTMANSLEVRVPFADYRIVEYAFNIPPEIKLYNGREKGLLREALRGILPDDITHRKKSPYPKTHNPLYTKYVQAMMSKILEDKNSPLLDLVNVNVLTKLNETGGSSIEKPWYGQLMKGPQLIAYLVQIDMWLREYNVKIEL